MTQITLAAARAYLDRALTLAAEQELHVSAAILDAGGHELAFVRSENANLATIDLAIRKARTAVYFKTATRDLASLASPGNGIGESTGGALVGIPGGVPITDPDGLVIGAIGLSGGTGDQDDAIASAALKI